MHKIIKKIVLLSFLSLGVLNNSSLLVKDKEIGFEESANDLMNNKTKLVSLKSLNENNDEKIETSKMFIQDGTTKDGKKCLRFAVALKGNISSLEFQRGHVEGKTDVDAKSVYTIYQGIEANGKTYYYNPKANIENGLTTDSIFAGEYYWACYTIRYLNLDFNTSNIPMSLLINGEQSVTRKASLAESIYGIHEHNFNNYLYNDVSHYKVCSLCGTIDDTSYEAHAFEISPKINKKYNIGDSFNESDLSLVNRCICHKELENVEFTYLKKPTTISFGDSVIIKTNQEVKKVVLPTNEKFDITKDDSSNLKYGGGNAGVVGKDTGFRFKNEYKIVDGKFKEVEPIDSYPYGNVFINIDMNLSYNPYMEFPIKLANDSNIKLFISTSNNYVKKDGVIGSYEQELKKTMDLIIDGETIDYNDVTLKALPQSAIDELNKTNADDLKKHIYFTFYEYELVTKKLTSGTHTVRLNFKNGYGDINAGSVDGNNKPCVGCINYFRYEALTSMSEISDDATYIELENNELVTYGSGISNNGTSVTPSSKLKIEKTSLGKYKVNSTQYDTYEAAYEAAYNSATTAGKAMVKNARGGDFLASIDGTGASFTINLKKVYSSKKELYLCGASNFVTVMKNWMPYQIDDMNLKDFMTVEINGTKIELADDLILPGIGDGTKGSHDYWTNWKVLNLGIINLDPSLEINTIKFSVSIDNALNEEEKYKYLYNQNENGEGGMFAFGQYDYVMIKSINEK